MCTSGNKNKRGREGVLSRVGTLDVRNKNCEIIFNSFNEKFLTIILSENVRGSSSSAISLSSDQPMEALSIFELPLLEDAGLWVYLDTSVSIWKGRCRNPSNNFCTKRLKLYKNIYTTHARAHVLSKIKQYHMKTEATQPYSIKL